MTDTSRLTDDQCAPYHRASEYLNEATCHLQETLSYADTLITVLYEAAALVDHLHEEGSSSQADIAAVMKAVEWLSIVVPMRLYRRLPVAAVASRPNNSPVFVVCLQAHKDVDPVRALKAALKVLKRRFGLRCVTIKEAPRRRR